MKTQYTVQVIVENKVSKYLVLNQSGEMHSKWDSFTGAKWVANDLNRMLKIQMILAKKSA